MGDQSMFMSPTKRHFYKVCVVGNSADSDVIDIFREYQYDLYESATGLEYVDVPDMVFFMKDFECAEFKNLSTIKKGDDTEGVPIIGPEYVRSHKRRMEELTLPRIRRSLKPGQCYGDSLRDVYVCFGVLDNREQKRNLSNFIRYLGGHLRKNIDVNSNNNKHIHVLLTTKAKGKIYRMAGALNSLIIRPTWVDEAWAQRDNYLFQPASEDVMKRHRLGAFEGLRLFLFGFCGEQKIELEKIVLEHFGTLDRNITELTTHVVCNPDASDIPSLPADSQQRFVTHEWLWSCVHASRCVLEDGFMVRDRVSIAPKSPVVGKSVSKSSLDDFDRSGNSLLNGTPDFSGDELETRSPRPLSDKKIHVCHEVIETEQNYLNSLNLLLKFRDQLIDTGTALDQDSGTTEERNMKTDLQLIFGKLPPLIDLHSKILADLKAFKAGSEKSMGTNMCGHILHVWQNYAGDLLRVYPPYMNNYITAKKLLDGAAKTAPKFHALIKAKEARSEFKRCSLSDLMIRPVQRLPSLTLLLKEMKKQLEKEKLHKQWKCLADTTIHSIEKVLEKANKLMKQADSTIEQMSRFTEIDHLPAHLVCFRREFATSVDCYSIGGTQTGASWMHGTRVRIMLFNDIFICCKIREVGGTLSRLTGGLTRQSSLSALLHTFPKPLRYLHHCLRQSVRCVTRVGVEGDGDGMFAEGVEAPVFIITIRESEAEYMWLLSPTDLSVFEKFVTMINHQICIDYERVIIGGTQPIDDITSDSEIAQPLNKWFRKQQTGNVTQTCSAMPPVHKPQTGFRRAISNASMTISSRIGLSRITSSRSNLHHITESSENSPASLMMPSPMTFAQPTQPSALAGEITPKRGLMSRKKLTASTFSLFRRGSFRGQTSSDKENQSPCFDH